MHEIKSPFLILMEEQSYLAQSLESAFEKQNVKVKIVTIAEASSIVISEKPSGYLICTPRFIGYTELVVFAECSPYVLRMP